MCPGKWVVVFVHGVQEHCVLGSVGQVLCEQSSLPAVQLGIAQVHVGAQLVMDGVKDPLLPFLVQHLLLTLVVFSLAIDELSYVLEYCRCFKNGGGGGGGGGKEEKLTAKRSFSLSEIDWQTSLIALRSLSSGSD